MTNLEEDTTARLHASALLLDSVSSLYNSGLISDVVAIEKVNCFFTLIDEAIQRENENKL